MSDDRYEVKGPLWRSPLGYYSHGRPDPALTTMQWEPVAAEGESLMLRTSEMGGDVYREWWYSRDPSEEKP